MNNNIICWFEIYTDDINRAKKFYTDVLGTQFIDTPSPIEDTDFKMSFFSSPQNQGVSGALIQMQGARNGNCGNTSTIVYFPCEDCSIEEARVEKAGGKVIKSKMSLGEHGFCSICLDSEQNTFGLYSMS
ncbi:VOC family protein [Pseudoxanthomonas sp. SGD-10]|nr:VOC family protein [Pseudoxanthomonas sp. SGD-10]